MQIVPYLVGGLTAFLVMDIAPITSATPTPAPAAALGTPDSSINRAAKAVRGSAPRAAQASLQIATVEVVGLRDAAVVYRDREGRELFRTDPLNNVTIITKGLQLPEVTVRQNSSSAVKPVPVRELQEQARDRAKPTKTRTPKVPLGCEPSFSPVAAPSLAHHTGRCMAALEDAAQPVG
jgi:hypothetical protein